MTLKSIMSISGIPFLMLIFPFLIDHHSNQQIKTETFPLTRYHPRLWKHNGRSRWSQPQFSSQSFIWENQSDKINGEVQSVAEELSRGFNWDLVGGHRVPGDVAPKRGTERKVKIMGKRSEMVGSPVPARDNGKGSVVKEEIRRKSPRWLEHWKRCGKWHELHKAHRGVVYWSPTAHGKDFQL